MSGTAERQQITVRVSSTIVETLSMAAGLMGTTLNSFVVQAALEKAQKIVDRENLHQASQIDAAMLLDLLDAPPKPNAARTRAYRRFMKEKYGLDTECSVTKA